MRIGDDAGIYSSCMIHTISISGCIENKDSLT